MSEDPYRTLKDGQSVESIAAAIGLPIETIWNAPENRALRELRGDPHVVNPGDKLFVPPTAPKTYTFETGKRHQVVIPTVKSKLQLQFKHEGKPRAFQPYVLKIDGGKEKTDKTDDQGKMETEISALAKTATISVGQGKDQVSYTLELRGLHPTSVTTGWQARLHNLGYSVGKVDGQPGRRSEAALCAFQEDQKKQPTGKPDQDTQDKLKELRGC